MSKQQCPNCHTSPIVRIHRSKPDGSQSIICNNCNEELLKDSSEGKYVKCSNKFCGYEGESHLNPNYNSVCFKCGAFLLHS